jgi:galactokinase
MTIEDLKSSFENSYDALPDAAYFSPGRVNLIGEHTDYNGGHVFPCALSFGTYLLLRKNGLGVVNFRSLNQSEFESLSFEKLTSRLDNSWVNYPLGVIAQFIKNGVQFTTGLDILIWGNVPTGAGLSSSASLEVVTAFAINDILETNYNLTQLAEMSQKAEHEFALVNCGIMDQFASANGKKDHAIFLDCNTLGFEMVPVILEGIKVVIANTHSPHKLDSGAYNLRVSECKRALAVVSKAHPKNFLAELTVSELKLMESTFINDPVAYKRARHVVSEEQRTNNAIKALRSGNVKLFGKLMNESHNSLRDDYEVTGIELDTMVEEARKIKGVIGSRMTGGGFGGCTVNLVKDESIEKFIEKVGNAYKSKIGITPEFYVADIGNGASKLF